MKKLFCYGTLRGLDQLESVLGHKYTGLRERVSLKGFTKYGLNILESEGSSVDGNLIEVNEADLIKLDHYEGAGWLYQLIDIEIDGHEDVSAYQQIDEGVIVVI